MTTPEVHKLLAMVRSRLWRAQFIAAVRKAMWASAALMLLAVAVHLAARRVPVEAVLLALSGLWVALLLRAAWQRPAVSACALWADRHLGGASAFTTLLEQKGGTPGHASAPVLRWLEDWATARVPDSLRTPGRTAGVHAPVAAAAVDAGVHGTGRRRAGAAGHRASVEAASRGIDAIRHRRHARAARLPASGELVSEIASALRSAQLRDEPERRDAGRAPATERGKADEGKEPSAAQAATEPTVARKSIAESTSGSSAEAARAAGRTQTAGTGAGRDAGDSRDDRSGTGVSPVPAGYDLRDEICGECRGARQPTCRPT